jgi:hypothetical protein
MGRATAARTLTARDSSSAPRFDIRLAEAADDAEIRRLLREHAMAGDVTLTLEREPDSTIAAAIEGDVQQTMIAREPVSGGIAGMASRSERPVFLNGQVTRIGYLGQLRTSLRGHRVASLLDEGFAFCRALHSRGTVRAYLTAIVEDNHRARRMLCGLRSPAAPTFARIGTLTTLAIPRGRQRGRASTTGIEIRIGSLDLLDDIVSCLNRNGRRHQFAPLWTVDDLISSARTPGLAIEDFLVATRGSRVVGCAALWDQRGFKQAMVRGYSPQLLRWRRLLNLAAPLFRAPALPPIGTALEFVYLSHVAVDDDRGEVMAFLLGEARRRLEPGVGYMVTAFSGGSPLLTAVTRVVPHRTYRSGLYLASWPDGRQLAGSIDSRLPHPEVAIL